MAYRLSRKESVEKSVQKIAREQIDKAIDEINDEKLSRHEVVHQVRKRCKKIRALIRLVRPGFKETYRRENAWYRDSAASLSGVRDAQSIIETYDKLMEHFQTVVERRAFSTIRRELTKRRGKVSGDETDLQDRLDGFFERMRVGRDRVTAWQLNEKGFAVVRRGLVKTYTRGRVALEQAYAAPTAENFHEWRKRTKYHWYHLRLLRPLWDGPVTARIDAVHALADELGDDHDLEILRNTLARSPDKYAEATTVQSMIGLITQRQVELRTTARPLGARVYAEAPKRFASRFQTYWDAWRSEVGSAPRLELICPG